MIGTILMGDDDYGWFWFDGVTCSQIFKTRDEAFKER